MDSDKTKLKNAKDNEQKAKVIIMPFSIWFSLSCFFISMLFFLSGKLRSEGTKLNTTKSTQKAWLFSKGLSRNS